jgi:hypothetical protein
MTITPDVKKMLEDKFLGKRVMVKTKIGKIGGICQFIGNNEYIPSFGLQITVDRMPITNIKIQDITLI